MKNYINSSALLFTLGAAPSILFTQAIYDANGQYKGYSQTSPSGVTNVYRSQGQYQSSSTTSIQTTPNTTINTPRQAPQAPSIKGW